MSEALPAEICHPGQSRRVFLTRAGHVAVGPALAGLGGAPAGPLELSPRQGFRGVFFNPNIRHAGMEGYPFPVFDPYGTDYRAGLRAALHELAKEVGINLVCVFIPIPFTLARPPMGPKAGQPVEEWANLTYLKNVALFVDDCHDAGVSVEFDLVDNRWIPSRVDRGQHIGGRSGWPVADDAPWDESATWYSSVIRFVESRTRHPERIAMWSMMGHYRHGTAELGGGKVGLVQLALSSRFR